MKTKRTRVALTCLLLAVMFSPATVFAWTGVTGQTIDVNGHPWTYGGEVYVFNNATGQNVASGDLVTAGPGKGSFTIPYTQMTHGGTGVAPTSGNLISVFIIFNDSGAGTPGMYQADYTEESQPGLLDLGFLSTDTADLEASTMLSSLKLGGGGVGDHDEFFEDYGEGVVLGNGNIVSVWVARENESATPDSPDGDGWGAFFRVLSPEGDQVAGPTAPYLDLNPSGTGNQMSPRVTPLTGGGFAMVWSSYGGPTDVGASVSIFQGGDTYVRVYDNAGNPVSGTGKVNESEPSGSDDGQWPVALISLSDGGFAVVWTDQNIHSGNRDDFFVRAYDADGGARAASVRLGPDHDTYFETDAEAVPLEDGKFAVSWATVDPDNSNPDTPSAGGDLDGANFFRIFNADGSAATAPIRPYLSINSTGEGNQKRPYPAALSNGNLALIWNSVNGPGDVFVDSAGFGGDTWIGNRFSRFDRVRRFRGCGGANMRRFFGNEGRKSRRNRLPAFTGVRGAPRTPVNAGAMPFLAE